jgi:hypothetical protein
MMKYLKILLLILIFLSACRERVNQFDPQSESFRSPPPIFFTWPTAGWYNADGYLVGIRIQVDFVESFPSTLSIMNILYRGANELTRTGVVVPDGYDSYTVDLIYGSIMDLGDYCVQIYFGEMAIGSCVFTVIALNGNLVIDGVSTYDTLDIGK